MKVQHRNLLLQNTKTNETEQNEFDVEEINSELIKILDDILLKIDWKKYL
ncbi:MAG: hypothetical protein WCB31_00635 [Nitrososphaeraceae archaeon]